MEGNKGHWLGMTRASHHRNKHKRYFWTDHLKTDHCKSTSCLGLYLTSKDEPLTKLVQKGRTCLCWTSSYSYITVTISGFVVRTVVETSFSSNQIHLWTHNWVWLQFYLQPTVFSFKNWWTHVLFMGPLIPLVRTSGDVCYWFQSQSGHPYSHLADAYMMYFPSMATPRACFSSGRDAGFEHCANH